jgi:Putative prokaryotic signal transducing protein
MSCYATGIRCSCWKWPRARAGHPATRSRSRSLGWDPVAVQDVEGGTPPALLDHPHHEGHFELMADDDALVVIATHLRHEEAGMLRGLLESAGITATVLNDVLVSLHPWAATGVARLAVFAPDVERAREIVKSAGAFPGSPGDEPVEIPEEEWSRTEDGQPAEAPGGSTAWRRLAVVGGPLLLAVLVFLRCAVGV